MLSGKELATFALGKIGTPYVYGAKGADGKFTEEKLNWLAKNYKSMFTESYREKAKKFIGKVCCDCSGLISWYTGKLLGSAQLYSAASKRGLIKDIDSAPIGAVLWKEGHVGVYIGNGLCVEEKGIDYGCVKSYVSNTKFTHWLLFSWMEYNKTAASVTTSKQKNPYKEPSRVIELGCSGDDVKWVQWELVEAGYKISIDGVFGENTKEALGKFQASCKIKKDYQCGEITRSKLKIDK